MSNAPQPAGRGMPLEVFPAYLALVQARTRALERTGAWDGRDCLLFRELLDSVALAARARFGVPGRPASGLDLQLLMIETVSENLTLLQALPAFQGLSERALRDILAMLAGRFFLVRRDVELVLDWMEAASGERLPGLARLYRLFLEHAERAGVLLPQHCADAALRLLRDPGAPLPAVLRPVEASPPGSRQLIFRAVRWLNPIQVRFVRELAVRLGRGRIVVEPTLPAEYGAAELVGRLEGLLRETNGPPLSGWVQDLADAVETRDAQLVFSADRNLDFNRSVGVYGEVEDLARRICWEMEHHRTRPSRIALIVRDMGEYSDAVTDVFTRFGIPFFFRRGRPAASVPLVKIILLLADLRARRRRDAFCALLESPWPKWPADVTYLRPPHLIAEDIRRAGIPPVPESAERLASRLKHHYGTADFAAAGIEAAGALAVNVGELWDRLTAPAASRPLGQHVRELRDTIRFLGIPEFVATLGRPTMDRPPGGGPTRDAVALSRTAWAFCDELLAGLGADRAFARRTMTTEEFALLLSELVANQTLPVPTAAPDGVWVINPYDAAGLEFDLVIIAGLNAGRFPARTEDQCLITESDRRALHEAVPNLPAVALPTAATQRRMESILFLTALGAARKRAVLSCQTCDTAGNDLLPSLFFNLLWELAGWAGPERCEADLEVSEYNRWRLQQPGAEFLSRHLEAQRNCPAPYRRTPFPGESFLATIPLALCRADDEARQRLASPRCSAEEQDRFFRCALRTAPSDAVRTATTAAKDGIELEAMRTAFFTRNLTAATQAAIAAQRAAERVGRFNGVVPEAEWRRVARLNEPPDLSPSALETLARCPFRYLVESILRAEVVEPADVEPDPRDTGRAVHLAMYRFLSILRGSPEALHWAGNRLTDFERYGSLLAPATVWRDGEDWRLIDAAESVRNLPQTARSIPVFTWKKHPGAAEEYRALATAVFDALCNEFRDTWNFGDRRLEELRRRLVRKWLANYVDNELAPPTPGKPPVPWLRQDRISAPALFEFAFSDSSRKALAPSLPLHETGRPGAGPFVKVHGKIDRVDLLFDAGTRRLAAIRVIDYKSLSRAGTTRKTLEARVASNEECQLPVYGLAALNYLFPEIPAEANAFWHNRTFVQYYGYGAARERVRKTAARNYLLLSGTMDDATGARLPLLEAFIARLVQNVERLRRGDLAVEPLSCEFCPYAGVCRVQVRRPALGNSDA
ncbi:MAG: hypothetical protein GXP31_01860 [Kiritimatiellaeota bacterium]|nr:hypothetical protein [Kiritimatiellota bacterium]